MNTQTDYTQTSQPMPQHKSFWEAHKVLKKRYETSKSKMDLFLALDAAKIAYKLLPPDSDDEAEGKYLCAYADTVWKLGWTDNAEALFQTHIKNGSGKPLGYMAAASLGHLYRDKGRYEESKNMFEVAMASGGKNNSVYAGMAKTCHQMGELKEAKRWYRAIVGKEDFVAEGLTRVHLREGNFKAADAIISAEEIRLKRMELKSDEPHASKATSRHRNVMAYLGSIAAINQKKWGLVGTRVREMVKHEVRHAGQRELLVSVAGARIADDINQQFCDEALANNEQGPRQVIPMKREDLVHKYRQNGQDYEENVVVDHARDVKKVIKRILKHPAQKLVGKPKSLKR